MLGDAHSCGPPRTPIAVVVAPMTPPNTRPELVLMWPVPRAAQGHSVTSPLVLIVNFPLPPLVLMRPREADKDYKDDR